MTASQTAATADADDALADDAALSPAGSAGDAAALQTAPALELDAAAARSALPLAHAALARAAQIDALVPRAGNASADASWVAGAGALAGAASSAASSAAASTVGAGAGSNAIGLSIGTAVGEPGFGQEVARGLVYLAHSGTQSAELSLHPVNLGPVRVSLQMDGQQATLVFSASHESTRNALQEALPQLHALFEQNGLRLGGAQVGDGSQAGSDTPGRSAGKSARGTGAAADVNGAAAAELATSAPRRIGLVDTFA